jgi:hypothetical protein
MVKILRGVRPLFPRSILLGHHERLRFACLGKQALRDTVLRRGSSSRLLSGGRAAARDHPPTGAPDPIAMAKMCSAVIPLPTPALTVGSVTEATVLPACSGTDAK